MSSIAWSTIVVVVLLFPGFAFVVGYYARSQITREIAPISALTELAVIVGISFLSHLFAYIAINQHVCHEPNSVLPCIDYDRLTSIIRNDVPPPKENSNSHKLVAIDINNRQVTLNVHEGEPELNPNESEAISNSDIVSGSNAEPTIPETRSAISQMLDEFGTHIFLYFLVLSILNYTIGRVYGYCKATGKFNIRTRHTHLVMLEQGIAANRRTSLSIVKANVVSKVSNNGAVVMYEGTLLTLYSKSDGTISYLALFNARKSIMSLDKRRCKHSTPVALDEVDYSERVDLLLKESQNGEDQKSSSGLVKSLLVLNSTEIANVYFSPIPKIDLILDTSAQIDKVKSAIQEDVKKEKEEKEKEEKQADAAIQAS